MLVFPKKQGRPVIPLSFIPAIRVNRTRQDEASDMRLDGRRTLQEKFPWRPVAVTRLTLSQPRALRRGFFFRGWSGWTHSPLPQSGR